MFRNWFEILLAKAYISMTIDLQNIATASHELTEGNLLACHFFHTIQYPFAAVIRIRGFIWNPFARFLVIHVVIGLPNRHVVHVRVERSAKVETHITVFPVVLESDFGAGMYDIEYSLVNCVCSPEDSST